jgi:acyl carrier protein
MNPVRHNPQDIETLIITWVKSNLQANFSKADLSSDINLLGLDSIDVVELCEHISDHTGANIDIETIFDLESLSELVDLVCREAATADAHE